MPTYIYFCSKCGEPHETIHGILENEKQYCPNCGTEMKKVIGGVGGLILKGAGFHANDYPKGGKHGKK